MEYREIPYRTKEEWLNIRRKGIGGSDAPAVCGLSPYRTPLQVYLEKIGEADPPQENRFMEWGRILEPVVAGYFAKKTGLRLSPLKKVLVSKDHSFMLANIDRKISGSDEGLEIKTTGMKLNGQIPDDYLIQCYHYLAVTGWKRWHLAVLIGGNDFRHYVIERDDEAISYLIEIERDFWENHVLKKVPPEPCWMDTETMSRLYPRSNGKVLTVKSNPRLESLVTQFLELKEQEEKIREAKEEIANKIKAFMGECEKIEFDALPHRVYWKNVSTKKFDVQSFRKDHPDLYEAYRKPCESRRFDVK